MIAKMLNTSRFTILFCLVFFGIVFVFEHAIGMSYERAWRVTALGMIANLAREQLDKETT